MPGYRALSVTVTGSAADSAREAESLRRVGEPETAVVLLEEALLASARITPELPGWLCGRLAALYRTLARYDDEVHLLERYRESQTAEDARSRYDARLSKARTIAERKRRSDSGALRSVRKVLRTPRRRSTPTSSSVVPALRATPLATPGSTSYATGVALPDLSGPCVALLGELLAEPMSSDHDGRLALILAQYTAAARLNGMPVEHLVAGLRAASRAVHSDHLSEDEREARYSAALVQLLASYFSERDR
jgi:hypothetical protein